MNQTAGCPVNDKWWETQTGVGRAGVIGPMKTLPRPFP